MDGNSILDTLVKIFTIPSGLGAIFGIFEYVRKWNEYRQSKDKGEHKSKKKLVIILIIAVVLTALTVFLAINWFRSSHRSRGSLDLAEGAVFEGTIIDKSPVSGMVTLIDDTKIKVLRKGESRYGTGYDETIAGPFTDKGAEWADLYFIELKMDKPVFDGKLEWLESEDSYEGDITKDFIPHGRGVYTYRDGRTLDGLFVDGAPYYGICTYPGGEDLISYTGHYSGWLPNGEGTAVYTDGGQYTGNWADGLRNGVGEFVKNGNSGSGSYLNDLPDGAFEITAADGEKRFVTFSGGAVDGNVRIEYADGKVYDGEVSGDVFDEIVRDGLGKMVYTNGAEYEGGWKEDKISGTGTYLYANGNRYTGEFSDGKGNGNGTLYYANGDRYTGEFSDGKKNGTGTYYYADGDEYTGEWGDGIRKNGILTLKSGIKKEYLNVIKTTDYKDENGASRTSYTIYDGIYTYQKTGTSFKGRFDHSEEARNWADDISYILDGSVSFADGVRTKEGKFIFRKNRTFPDGTYTGLVLQATKTTPETRFGYGTLTYNNGDKYEGEFYNDLPDGKGILTLANGDIYKGIRTENYVGVEINSFCEGRKNGDFVVTLSDGSREYRHYDMDELIPCGIRMAVTLEKDGNITKMKDLGHYTVTGGEKIVVNTKEQGGTFVKLSYYLQKSGEESNYDNKMREYTPNWTYPVPAQKPGEVFELNIEAQCEIDRMYYYPDYLRNTGWNVFYLEYAE